MDDNWRYVVVNQIDNYDSDILRVRATLKREFSKFGQILKLFVEEHAKFAKVYFETFDICDCAVRALKRNQFGWKVSHPDHTHQNFRNQNNTSTAPKRSVNSKENNNRKHSSADTLEMDEDYLDEEFSENFDYCNVHGHPLSILQAESGEFYINLRDIRRTGFALFRRDTFDSILIDRQQISKEFELHLLSEAKNYILKNRVNCIDEEQILQTIERCKNRLLNNSANTTNGQISRTIPNTKRSEQQPQFSDNRNNRRSDFNGRSDVPSQEKQSDFSDNRNNRRSDFNSWGEASPRPRQPKTLSENFMPSNSYSSNLNQNRKNDNRDNREHKSSSSRSDSNGWDINRSDFSKNEPSRSDSSKGSFRDTNRQESNRGGFSKKDFNKGFESTPEPNKFGGNKKQDQSKSRVNTSRKSEIRREKLELGKTYDVKICYCEPEKDNVIWIQLVDSLDLCDKMLVDISEMEPTAAVVSDPSNGQLVLGEFEGIWFRAEVVNSSQKLVHFIDYGNQSVADMIKVIPDKLKDSPALAIRMVVNFNNPVKPNEGDDLTVSINKQYDDGTYLANIVSKSAVSEKTEVTSETSKPVSVQNEDLKETEISQQIKSPPSETQDTYIASPVPLTTLKDGDRVMFSEHIGTKFALKTKGCVDKSKELIAYIRDLDKSSLVITKVMEGQMVLCSKEGHSGLCRAVVKEVRQGNVVSVKYVDYPGEDVLTIKSLRNVDYFLSEQPSALLMSPDIWYLNNLNMDAINFLTELVGRKEKAVVVMTEKGMDFRLESNKLLSEVIAEKLPSSNGKGEPVKQSSEVESEKVKKTEPTTEQKAAEKLDEKVVFDNMDWIKLNPGEYDFICYHLKDARDITMVSTLDDHVKYMEDVADIPDPDKKPYKPEIYEMCLVYYTEDTEGFWYRGVVLDIDGTDYTILMVDFGNETTVPCDKIRKFPAKLQNIPILGLPCDFKSLPNTPEVTAKLKELIQDNQNIKTVIKGFDDETLKYIIDIPHVREQITEAGLC